MGVTDLFYQTVKLSIPNLKNMKLQKISAQCHQWKIPFWSGFSGSSQMQVHLKYWAKLLPSAKVNKVYVRHEKISCLDVGPAPKTSRCAYANIPKPKRSVIYWSQTKGTWRVLAKSQHSAQPPEFTFFPDHTVLYPWARTHHTTQTTVPKGHTHTHHQVPGNTSLPPRFPS